jgi:hypothetical protein
MALSSVVTKLSSKEYWFLDESLEMEMWLLRDGL